MNPEETTAVTIEDRLEAIETRLDRIEALLQQALDQRSIKERYTVAELAEIVQRSEYQVRVWCQAGRLAAEKEAAAYGANSKWRISHEELVRYQNQGLRPRGDGRNA